MRGRGLILFVAIGSVVAFWLYRKYRVAPDLHVVQLPLKNLDGSAVNMNQYKGKTLFVNYWATWCGDCIRELPSIQKAYEATDTGSVIFLMVSDEPAERITRFLTQHDYGMKFVRIDQHFQELGINSIPTTYIFNAEGQEIFTKVGATDWSDPGMLQLLKQQQQ